MCCNGASTRFDSYLSLNQASSHQILIALDLWLDSLSVSRRRISAESATCECSGWYPRLPATSNLIYSATDKYTTFETIQKQKLLTIRHPLHRFSKVSFRSRNIMILPYRIIWQCIHFHKFSFREQVTEIRYSNFVLQYNSRWFLGPSSEWTGTSSSLSLAAS